MARMARVVVPAFPHHVTQRGSRRQRTFFGDSDYRRYLCLLAAGCAKAGTRVWAYCLMPNHVHLVLVPAHEDGLRAPVAGAHQRYARAINDRYGWRGHLWQERFYSFPMDESHLISAVRYVELNPVAAGLCERAHDWPWSSASAHIGGRDDALVEVDPMLALVDDWASYLDDGKAPEFGDLLAKHSRTGRPLGGDEFIERLESLTGRALRRRKGGRPRKSVKN